MLDYVSICSGIEAASVAWEKLGFKPLAFAEIDAFPASVLAHRWPRIVNIKDMLLMSMYIKLGLIPAPDVLVGGTPCQSYSIAGKRAGLDDPRGQLTLAYVDILNTIDEMRGKGDECVCVWENVPGVLSDSGNAFGEFLSKLAGESEPLQPSGGKWTNAGCVFGPQRTIAWRVIDAQYFGVAQRRRRIILIASARPGFDPCKVLFEFDGMRRDIAPSRTPGQEVAATLSASLGRRCGVDDRGDGGGNLQVAGDVLCMAHGQAGAEINVDKSPALTCNHEAPIVSFAENSQGEVRLTNGDGKIVGALSTGGGKPGQGCPTIAIYSSEVCPTLNSGGNTTGGHRPPGSTVDTAVGMQVRRLMPSECAALQDFPRDHCKIPYRGKPADACPDGPQYKAYGNSMAVCCMKWVGERLLNHYLK